jgi:iron complex outermembrane receptor protein
VGQPRVTGFRDGDQDASNRYHFRYGGGSLKADLDLGGLSLTSLSAARWMHARYGTDLDQGPQPLLSAAPKATQAQLSQEFQLQSGPQARVPWLAGLYYIRIEERYEPTTFTYGGAYSAMLGGRTFQTLTDRGVGSSYAAYGQATAPLGDRTRLTGGLRYTIETRSVEARGERRFAFAPFVRPIPGLPLTNEAPLHADDSFHELTWRASLDHELSDTTLAYISASRGFQSGGWNLQTPQAPPFGPERLTAFETGVKYFARSGRLSLDAAAFAYDYADLQVSAFTPLGSITTNATSADIYGLDLQLEALLTSQTRASVGAQYLHAHFNAFRNATCADYSPAAAVPYAPAVCDASGNRLPFAPALRFNLGLRHEMPLRRGGLVLVGGNLAYNSTSFAEADNVVRQPRFATLDLSAEWRPGAAGPSVRLWALNVTGVHRYDSLVTFPTTGVLQRPAAPRRFGVSLTYGL